VIVGTGTLIVMACLGFGRFALGMLLPAMGEALDLSYSQMGLISTGNFAGYLIAVILSGRLYSILGAKRIIVSGLLLSALTMAVVSRASGFWQVFIPYVLTGVGSGAAFVPVMALVSHWFKKSHRGRAAGSIVIGAGVAFIISGWFIPYVNAWVGTEGWRTNWMILGGASFAVALVAVALLKDTPEQIGLSPLGTDPVQSLGADALSRRLSPKKAILILGGLYFFFGYTYVIYATFIVTTLVQEVGMTETVAGHTWMWIGAFSLLSGPVFGWLSDKLGRRAALSTVFGFQLVSYLFIAFNSGMWMIFLSVAFYGVALWAIPGIMAATVGDYMGPQKAALAFGTITIFFGAGQVLGPAAAGVLADWSGSFTYGYLMAAGMAGIAIVGTKLLPARS